MHPTILVFYNTEIQTGGQTRNDLIDKHFWQCAWLFILNAHLVSGRDVNVSFKTNKKANDVGKATFLTWHVCKGDVRFRCRSRLGSAAHMGKVDCWLESKRTLMFNYVTDVIICVSRGSSNNKRHRCCKLPARQRDWLTAPSIAVTFKWRERE